MPHYVSALLTLKSKLSKLRWSRVMCAQGMAARSKRLLAEVYPKRNLKRARSGVSGIWYQFSAPDSLG